MLLNFKDMPETIDSSFRGGAGEIGIKAFQDGSGRIIAGRLTPGAWMGRHMHELESEVILVIKGHGEAECGSEKEDLTPGTCHYCPAGTVHTIRNIGDEDLLLWSVTRVQHRPG